MARIFISHASIDAGQITFLVKALEASGHSVLFTSQYDTGLPPGDWLDSLEEGVKSADLVVFWITKGWMKSPWCRVEYVFTRMFAIRPLFFKEPSVTFDLIATDQVYPTNLTHESVVSIFQMLIGEKAAVVENGDPYPGFSAFDESLSHFFFGRHDTIKHLVSWAVTYKVKGHKPFRALTGASGVGKTSLLRAGLHAALIERENAREVAMIEERRRLWGRKITKTIRKKQRDIRIATAFDRGESPLQCVRRCLATLLEMHDRSEVDATDTQSLQDLVIARYATTPSDKSNAKGIILIDSFERFYQGDGDNARSVIKKVATQARINVVITIRSSYHAQLTSDPVLNKILSVETLFDIDTELFRDVIELPAERCGWSVEPNLTNLLSAYFREHQQSLPLIAYIMRSVWREREADEGALKRRRLSSEILASLAGVPPHNAELAIDHLIEELCEEIDAKLSPEMIEALAKLLFRMCRWDNSGDEVSSVGCRLREEDEIERDLVDILCSSEYRLFVTEKRNRENAIIVSAVHDRILWIWKRARETLDGLKLEMMLLSAIEHDLRRIKSAEGFSAWLDLKTLQQREEIVSFFELWFDSLGDELRDLWTAYRKRVSDEKRSTAETKKLLRNLGASRAITAGILADLMFAQADPCQAVQIALAAQETSPKGHPYKAVTTAVMRGLHEIREAAIFQSSRAKGIADSCRLFGGSRDEESNTVSAFTGMSRITWDASGEATAVDILPSNHRAILTLTDGGWGCILSRKDTNTRYSETAILLHHVSFKNPLRFDFGRKRVVAGAMFEGGEWLSFAIAWQKDLDERRHDKAACTLGLCRLKKQALFELSEQRGYRDFLNMEEDSHDWTGFEINALAWAGAGPRLFVGGGKGGHEGGYGQVWEVSVSPSGLALAGQGKEIVGAHKGVITGAAISRDGQLLITGGSDGRAIIHDLRHDSELVPPKVLRGADKGGFGDIRAHDGSIEVVALSRDGMKAFTASTGTSIKMWDTITGQKLAEMKGHGARIADMKVSNDGRRLYSFSNDGTARCWDVAAKAPMSRPLTVADRPMFLTYRGDGEILCADSSGKIWQGKRNGHTELLHDFKFRIRSGSVFANNGAADIPTLCVVGEACVGVFELITKSNLTIQLPRLSAGRPPIALSICRVDKNRALIGLTDGHLFFLTRNDHGQYALRLTSVNLQTAICSLTTLQDGRVLCGRSDGYVSILSNTYEEIGYHKQISNNKRARVSASIEIPSHAKIATACAMGWKYPIQLWDQDLGGKPETLCGHTAPIEALGLLSDGRTLVSAGRDCTVRFWDVAARIELGAIRAFPDWTTRLAVSPSGDVIAVGGADDQSIREWGAAPIHYRSASWQTAPDQHYSKPAFKDAMEDIEELRPTGLSTKTLKRYFLATDGGDGEAVAEHRDISPVHPGDAFSDQ